MINWPPNLRLRIREYRFGSAKIHKTAKRCDGRRKYAVITLKAYRNMKLGAVVPLTGLQLNSSHLLK